MNRTSALALGLFAAGCAPKGTYDATLVDALTNEPLANARALLKTQSNDFACQVFETTSDDAGVVHFEGMCADYDYTLTVPDGAWKVEDMTIPGGEVGLTATVKLWPLPGKAGLWLRNASGELESVSTASDITTDRIWDSEESVRYPDQVPARLPRVEEGAYLVVAGDAALAKTLHPLLQSEHIRLGTPDKYFNMQPWHYIGVSFEDASTFTRHEAEIDATKIVKGNPVGTSVQYWPMDLVPAGRYALLADDDKRTYIVDFGSDLDAKKAAAEAAEQADG